MFNPLSAADTERASRLAALALIAAAGLLTIWLLARVIWLFVPRAELPAAAALALAPAQPVTSANSIAQWHLFGNAQGVDIATLARNTPQSALKLVLHGTVALPDAKAGIAIISDESGEHHFNVGDTVAGVAKLTEVYADHVVIEHNGSAEAVGMQPPQERTLASDRRGAQSGSTVTSVPSGFLSNATSPGGLSAANPNPGMAALRASAADFARQVQVEPVFDGGKIAGARVSGSGAAGAMMNKIGLRPSDVVTAVNGTALAAIPLGNQQALLEKFGNATSVQVAVLRDGKPVTLTYSP